MTDQMPSNNDSLVSSNLSSLSRKESYKEQRKNYQFEKRKATKELLATLKDPTIVVLADFLKVRGTLKSWTKLWCVLKPGILLLYKTQKVKSSQWIGTILLSTCRLIERPSKKDGFCFKLYHPLDQSIWAPKGPEGETLGAVVQPLPTSHLIFRAPSLSAGKCWMDALELSVRCSSLLMTTMGGDKSIHLDESDMEAAVPGLTWNESDVECHFKDQDLDDASHTDDADGAGDGESISTAAGGGEGASESESEEDEIEPLEESQEETIYVEQEEGYLGVAGEQTEELGDENKSLIWFLIKQLRPGMDLSKVVLPTFILEPRSFLDKLADYYYHADIIGRAAVEDDPFTRLKTVVKWYLSGFYKKPKGLKKPYNPIIGETFRCYWRHPNGSRTYYIAEQVSHHPPVSALYVTNRQEGFALSATILAKSKYHGNSLSAILEGSARLTLLNRGEDYLISMPYAYCKGILLGTLSMELGGDVSLRCDKTGYSAELSFKLTPLFGRADQTNSISGKIKLGKETLATIEGHWDSVINITDKKTGETQVLWHPTPEARQGRLKRFTVPIDQQSDWESERLWQHVTTAISIEDQEMATVEKTKLEDAQRGATKDRKVKEEAWSARLFDYEPETEQWLYKHADIRPWDPRNDLNQFESDYVVRTKMRHKTPVIRSNSISIALADRGSSRHIRPRLMMRELGSSSVEEERQLTPRRMESEVMKEQFEKLREDLKAVEKIVKENETSMKKLMRIAERRPDPPTSRTDMLMLILVVGIVQAVMLWSLLAKLNN